MLVLLDKMLFFLSITYITVAGGRGERVLPKRNVAVEDADLEEKGTRTPIAIKLPRRHAKGRTKTRFRNC